MIAGPGLDNASVIEVRDLGSLASYSLVAGRVWPWHLRPEFVDFHGEGLCRTMLAAAGLTAAQVEHALGVPLSQIRMWEENPRLSSWARTRWGELGVAPGVGVSPIVEDR